MVLRNAAAVGSGPHLCYLAHQGALQVLCSLFQLKDEKIVFTALEAIQCLLAEPAVRDAHALRVDGNGRATVDWLKLLQQHAHEPVRLKANWLLKVRQGS
jgi:hypothetical protein